MVGRIEHQLRADASRNSLVNPELDRQLLLDSLRHTENSAWVYELDDDIGGHLYGAVLSDRCGPVSWTGPDGSSFDGAEVLDALLLEAVREWRGRGVKEHRVWCLSEPDRVMSWTDSGYSLFSVRGARELVTHDSRSLPMGYSLRRGTPDDFERAIELDAVLDTAQAVDVRSKSSSELAADQEDLFATLNDLETHHYVVEFDKRVIAQCVTFPAPPRRGSFDNTLYLSEVVVDPHHQRRGVASAMLDAALNDAIAKGFRYAAVQWRSANLGATLYWTSYGFHPTYVRLQRTL